MRAILPPDNEECFVREFLGGTPGYFVDVGANDPQIGSQTWQLEQAGWDGVLIEPQPDLVERLRMRKAKVFAVACSSRANAGRTLPLHVAGALSSLSESLVDPRCRADSVIAVPVRTLDQILDEARAPTPVDFLSIDVEGHAVEVLDGTDLARWRPRLILIEDHVMDLRIHRHLVGQGYLWFRRTGLNSWYAPADMAPVVEPFGRWQFIRKYYLGTPFRHLRDAMRRVRQQLRGRRT
jgi:FkbM family methyltransferase